MLESKPNQSQNNNLSSHSPGGILKFVNQFNSAKRIQGKKCNPHRQFGISSDAPIQFCSKNTLICDMNKFREFRHNASQKPEFYSQKNFFNISQGSNNKELGKNFIKQYNQSNQKNSRAFHHKTSKISNFYDQNAWMGSRFYVMGHQRSENALELANNDIQFNTRSARSLNLSKKRTMTSKSTFRTSKVYPTHQSMKSLLFKEKSKIRQMRNSLGSYYSPSQLELQRPKTSFQISSRTLKISQQKKPRQFEINLPEWGEKDFNVRFIDWNPQKPKQTKTHQAK